MFENFFVFRLLGGRRQAEMGKEWGKRLGGEGGLEGRGKALFRGAVGWLGEFSGLGAFWRLRKPSETA